jgi:hypothetical protein
MISNRNKTGGLYLSKAVTENIATLIKTDFTNYCLKSDMMRFNHEKISLFCKSTRDITYSVQNEKLTSMMVNIA